MRLAEEFRERTKRYASAIVQLYVQLPRSRREVEVLGHQLLRSGTSVRPGKPRERDPMPSSVRKLTELCRKPMSRNSGSNFCAKTVVYAAPTLRNCIPKQMN